MIRVKVTDRHPLARITESQIKVSITEPNISCRLTDKISDEELFFSVFTSRGEEKLTVIDPKGNHVYLTGKR